MSIVKGQLKLTRNRIR